MKRFKIAKFEDGIILAECEDKENAIDLRSLHNAMAFILPKEDANNYKIGDILPRNILRSCEIEELENTLGYLP